MYCNSLLKRKPRHAYAVAAALALTFAGFTNPEQVHASAYQSLHDFSAYPTGGHPSGAFVRAADGALYGVTAGGAYGYGQIFSISATGVYSSVYSFKGGSDPINVGGLSAGPDGALYGASNLGGAYGAGALFKFNPSTATLTVLSSFKGLPFGGYTNPVAAADGSVYGSFTSWTAFTYRWTPSGGLKLLFQGPIPLCAGGDGYVYGMTEDMFFRFNSDGSKHKLRDITAVEGLGDTPFLAPGPGATIWGASDFGGPNSLGVEFKIGTDGQNLSIIHTNTATDSLIPRGPIAVGPDNRLYSYIPDGIGDMQGNYFSMGLDGTSKFLIKTTAAYDTQIAFDKNGNFYLPDRTNPDSAGSILKIKPSGVSAPVKFFKSSDLASPSSPPVRLGTSYYGTASGGGAFDHGGIFRLTSDGKYTILYNFTRSLGSSAPALTVAADGNAYTLAGSQFCKVTPNGTVIPVTLSLAAAPQDLANATLTPGSNGLLYALVNASLYSISYTGVATAISYIPNATSVLAFAPDGNMYEPINVASNGKLEVSKATPDGTVTFVEFGSALPSGNYSASFKLGPDGALYGVALDTQQGDFVFKIDVTAGTFTKVYTFPASPGYRPTGGSVAIRTDGSIFVPAYLKAANGLSEQGVVYKITPSGQGTTVASIPKHDFPTFSVAGTLAMDGDHTVIGATAGGPYGDGAIFQVIGL